MKSATYTFISKSSLCLPITFMLLLFSSSCSKNEMQQHTSKALTNSIIYGKQTAPNSFNSVVLIISKNGAGESSCTGTLIDSKTVLTAAHCISMDGPIDENYAKNTKVIIGTGAIGDKNLSYEVAWAVPHPEFILTSGGSLNDFGYLKLKKAVPESIAKPVPLISKKEWKKFISIGSKIHVFGYGLTENSTLRLKKDIQLKIVSFNEDKFSVRGKNGAGVCVGDSGGPSFIKVSDGTLRQASVTSSINGMCNNPNLEGYLMSAVRATDFLVADNLLRIGKDLEKNGNYKSAWEKYAESLSFLSFNPETVNLYSKLTVSLKAEDKISFGAAANAFETINSSMLEITKAKGQIKSAIEYALKLKKDPKKLFTLATLYLQNKDSETAFKYAEQYVKQLDVLAKQDIWALRFLAIMAADLSKLEYTKRILDRMYNINPNFADTFILRGNIAMAENRAHDAVTYYELYFQLSNDEKVSSLIYPLYLKALKKSGAEAKIIESSMLSFTNAVKSKFLEKAKENLYFNDVERAMENIISLLKIDPRHLEAMALLVRVFNRNGKYEKTLKLAQQCLDHIENDPDKLKLRIKLLMSKGTALVGTKAQSKEAKEVFKQVLALDPFHAKATTKLVALLIEDEDYYAAGVYINNKIAHQATLKDYHSRSSLYLAQGQFDKALKDVQKIVQIDPTDLGTYLLMAVLYVKTGDYFMGLKCANDILSTPYADKSVKDAAEEVITLISK